MPLSDRKVRSAKPKPKDYKLFDEKGLYLLVKTNGGKYWRLKYRFSAKEKLLALGVYPGVSLNKARRKVDTARDALSFGNDPGAIKQAEKNAEKIKKANSFEFVAREWWDIQKEDWTDKHANRVLSSLEMDIFPYIGDEPIAEIKTATISQTLKRVEHRGALDVAGRVLQRCSTIFQYAVKTGKAEINPARELQGTLKTRKVKHQPSLPRKELPALLKRLKTYDGLVQTRLALRFLMLTFVRPGELRGARWEEIDFDAKEWRIPAERMKMKVEHIVPLSKQAIAILKELKPITGQYELIFPGERRRNKPMSENTLLFALYRLGYKDRATPHGFRATASSILNEQNFNRDAIERQLSHMERNKVRGSYTHHAEYLKERKKIMQWWADYLDDLEHEKIVVAGNFNKQQ